MESDWSAECSSEDPWVVVPWEGVTATEPSLRFFDLRAEPDRVVEIPDAARYSVLAAALKAWNTPAVFTAKCDVWHYAASAFDASDLPGFACAHASYIDLLPGASAQFASFMQVEFLARRGAQVAAAISSSVGRSEWILRRARICTAGAAAQADGFAVTLYVWGYGEDEIAAEKAWTQALLALILPVRQLFEEASRS
jgi:hypothetical protein